MYYIAYNNNLGAGALVYLRKVYECLTKDIAKTSKISLTDNKGNIFVTTLENYIQDEIMNYCYNN